MRAGRFVALTLVGGLISAQPAAAAFYPLELTNIKPVGAARELDDGNRIYRAYPGISTNVTHAAVVAATPRSPTRSPTRRRA